VIIMSRMFEKYTDQNPPIQCFMPDSTWYKGSTAAFTPKGILWHDTGADNPWLKRYVQPADNDPKRDELLQLIGKNTYGNDWEHTEKQAGLNCWVGKLQNGQVTTLQAGPWTKRPWGCGSQRRNNVDYSLNDTHIQWEICQDAKTDKAYFADVYEESVQLSAYLCKKFNIDPNGTITYKGIKVPTIVCHWDSYNLGCGSGHGDIYDWTVMYDYLGISRKSVNINDPYNNAINLRIRSDITKAMKDPEPTHKDGWCKVDGKWYFYQNGQMLKSSWVTYKGDRYYMGADGAMVTGWQTIEKLDYYFYSGGAMAVDEWIDGWFLDMDGHKTGNKGSWKTDKTGKWWQAGSWYPKNRYVRIDEKEYQFNSKGYLIEK